MKKISFALFAALIMTACTKQQLPVANYDIIPQPKELRLDDGKSFELSPKTVIHYEVGLQREAQFLSEYVDDIMGYALKTQEYQGQTDGIVLKLSPADFNQAKAATLAAAEHVGPVYLRLGRSKMPCFLPDNEEFVIGKAQLLNEGTDVTLFACGHLVWEALQAAEQLEKEGIRAEVINIHTIKPLDVDAIIASARKTRAVVTCEEHLFNGGLGDSVAQVLALHCPTPMEYVAVDDRFGESGTPDEMLTNYHLRAVDIVEKAHAVLKRKA